MLLLLFQEFNATKAYELILLLKKKGHSSRGRDERERTEGTINVSCTRTGTTLVLCYVAIQAYSCIYFYIAIYVTECHTQTSPFIILWGKNRLHSDQFLSLQNSKRTRSHTYQTWMCGTKTAGLLKPVNLHVTSHTPLRPSVRRMTKRSRSMTRV